MDKQDRKVDDVKVGKEHTPAAGCALDDLAAVNHGRAGLGDGAAGREDHVTGDTGRQAEG